MTRYALVVGIAQYDNSLGSLTKPTNDAEAVGRVLEEYGDFQVKRLPQGWNSERNAYEVAAQRLNGENLGQGLEDFLKQADMKEALIYFSGHGFTVSDNLRKKKGYLGTSDCTSSTIATRGISLDSLNELILESNLSSLVVLLDCCHAGSILENNLMRHSMTAFNSSQKDYYLIAACRDFESSWEGKQYSVFTEALLKGLQVDNAGSDGKVSCDRLFDTINTELKHSGQEPIRMGWGVSITLVTYKHQRQARTFEVKDECPYQGLKAFEAEQKEFFFGRKQVVREILGKLKEKPFVPIIGASGSGKSSVVRAGLIRQLDDSEWQVLKPIMPGFKPLRKLSGAFGQFFEGSEKEEQLENLIYTESNSLPAILENLPGSAKFLLVVDQFEEVFTGGASQQEKQRFIDLLTQVVEITDSRLAVVITMRADFLEPCLDYPSLTHLIQTQAVFMPPLTGVDLKDTIIEPAKLQGHSVEEGLLLKILEDVKQEPGFLPLMEFALTKLWEKRDQEKHQLTLEEYEKLGGLTGALNLHAEKVYHCQNYQKESPTPERSQQEKEWIQRIFLRLVRTGEGEKDTRQRQPKATLLNIAGDDPKQRQQLSKLIDGEAGLVKGRLLVTGKDEKGEAWIDLAHEALIESWQQFAQWRQKDRDLRRLSDRLEDTRREWVNKKQDDKYLMQGGLLAEVRDSWQQLQPHLQSPQEDEDFYQRSDAHEKDRIAELERALTESRLREKAARVENLLTVQPLDSLVLAIQAIGENQEKLPQQILAPVQNSLNRAMNKARVSIPLRGHEASVNSVAISADGQTIVSGGGDGTVRLWNLQGQTLAEPLRGHEDSVKSVAISADGQTIVSGGDDGTVRLWNLQGQTLAEPLRGHEGSVNSVAISADGQTIVSGGNDGTVRLWNLQGQTLAEPLRGHEGWVWSVAISTDGQTIVSGGDDGTVWLWNLQGQTLAEPLRGHEGWVWSVAISADGQTIVSGGGDGTVRLWNLQGQTLAEPLRGHEGSVKSVAISADGQTIVSGGDDGTVRLWNFQGQTLAEPLRGHEGYVNSVAISADGQKIVSGGRDGTVRLWNLQGQTLAEPLRGHEGYVNSVAISADGQTIVSGGRDGTVRLWNLQGQTLAEPLRGHEGWVWSVAISADGQTIFSGGDDGTVRLWNLQGQTLAEPLRGHEGWVWSVAISADGQTIFSGGDDGTVRLWNLQGQTLAEPLRGHVGYVYSVAISADGQTIVSGGDDGTVRLWNLQGQTLAEPLRGHEGWVWSVAISADGQTIFSGGRDGTVRLWNLQGQTLAEPLRGHEGWVYSVAISADGQTIVSGGEDGTVRLWNLQGQTLAEPLRGHEGDVRSVAISADGQTIVSGGEDGTVRLWRGGWRAWLQVCCNRLRYHPIFTNPQTEEAKAACEVCRKYVWSKEHG
ncbi:nSTAND1 domain-containing NTPase [Nostoc sp.]|uniref:nSTAND1 domain-containing NTPase n=1 Tax=Nostoc sp. TaxID=1180 RepID=UPI002FFAF176